MVILRGKDKLFSGRLQEVQRGGNSLAVGGLHDLAGDEKPEAAGQGGLREKVLAQAGGYLPRASISSISSCRACKSSSCSTSSLRICSAMLYVTGSLSLVSFIMAL